MNKTFVTGSDFARFCQRSQTRHLFQPFFRGTVCVLSENSSFTTEFMTKMLPFGMMMHTFSPGEPRGPASPGRPERPFGPSGPSSPRGPAAPSSPWKVEEAERTTESFIDAFKKKKKITCVLWCPKICPNIKNNIKLQISNFCPYYIIYDVQASNLGYF